MGIGRNESTATTRAARGAGDADSGPLERGLNLLSAPRTPRLLALSAVLVAVVAYATPAQAFEIYREIKAGAGSGLLQ